MENAPTDAAPATRVRYENLPIVVIAGRPNVGKSTLYNRLLHKRRAITEPTPGVTRDAVDSVCELRESGKVFKLIDTGGFKLERRGLDELVVAKSLASIEGADLILFLVDAMSITPEDEEFASLLRKWTPKVLLVVNKADSPDRDANAWTHAAWGFEPVIFVSAEHGRNIDLLEAEVVSRLDFSRVIKVDEERAPIRLAIMGKPNTGKSTLLNRLVGEEKSIVSEVAGTTRDIVEGSFERKGRRFTVLDTAGIRRKGKVTENVEYYSVHRAIHVVEDCDVVVLMIDAVEGLTDQDKKIAAFAVEEGRGVILALNKWDTMPDLKNSFEAARDKLRFFFGQMAWAPVIPISAKKGEGMDKLVSTIITLHAQLNKRIETAKLNKAIEAWVEHTPPPVGPRTRFKLRYAVQTSVNPQKFVIFASRPDAVTEAYVSFLRNKIRDELGMDMIPLTLEVKASHVPIVRPAPTRAEKMKEAAKRPAPAPRAGTSKKAKRESAAHQGSSARSSPIEKRAAAAKKKSAGKKENAAKKASDAQRGVTGKKSVRSAAGLRAGAARKGAVAEDGAAKSTAVKGPRSSSRAADPRKRERRGR
jgi:GTP-binding protein